MLFRDKGRSCQNVPASGKGKEGSLLLCCHEDMCNHVDSPEAREKYNETILGEYFSSFILFLL